MYVRMFYLGPFSIKGIQYMHFTWTCGPRHVSGSLVTVTEPETRLRMTYNIASDNIIQEAETAINSLIQSYAGKNFDWF